MFNMLYLHTCCTIHIAELECDVVVFFQYSCLHHFMRPLRGTCEVKCVGSVMDNYAASSTSKVFDG